MKNLRKFLVLAIVAIGVLAMNACDQAAINEEKEALTSVSDYLNVSNSFALSDEEEITNDDEGGLKASAFSSCLTVTIHENETGEFWPRNWTLDFGTENCELHSGNVKRGKIHVSLSDRWRNEGSLKQITFEDYYFNDSKLEGVKSILNTGLNDSGNMTFTKKVENASIIYPDGSSITWTCERESELIEGGGTFLFVDDVWSVRGSGYGVNLDEKNYTMVITSPLIYKNGCFYPVSGIIEIQVEEEELIVINYGEGECDNQATSTCCGITEIIDL